MAEEAGPTPEGSGVVEDNQYPDPLPKSYGELQEFIKSKGEFNLFELRLTAFKRIQSETNRPLLCYATQTSNVPNGAPVSIRSGVYR